MPDIDQLADSASEDILKMLSDEAVEELANLSQITDNRDAKILDLLTRNNIDVDAVVKNKVAEVSHV